MFQSQYFGRVTSGRAIRFKSSLFLRQAVGFPLLSLTHTVSKEHFRDLCHFYLALDERNIYRKFQFPQIKSSSGATHLLQIIYRPAGAFTIGCSKNSINILSLRDFSLQTSSAKSETYEHYTIYNWTIDIEITDCIFYDFF